MMQRLAMHNDLIGVLVSGLVISDLQFADDICLLTDIELDLQSRVDKFSGSSGLFGLPISGTKSAVKFKRCQQVIAMGI